MDAVLQSSYQPLWRRVLSWPRTSPGRWSLGLLAGFVVLLFLFAAIVKLYGGVNEVRRLGMQAGGGFFSLPLVASTLLAAALSAVGALISALVAIFREGERSILMALPILVGGLVLLFAVGEVFE